MICQEVEKNLVFYWDNELPRHIRSQIEDHLQSCEKCAELAGRFFTLWDTVSTPERMKPSPYFWTRLKQRVSEKEQKRFSIWDVFGGLVSWTRPAIALAAVVIGILLGYHLGNVQQLDSKKVSKVQEQPLQELFDSQCLSALESLPSQSFEAVYFNMILQN